MRKTTLTTWALLLFLFSLIAVCGYYIRKDRNQGYIGMYPLSPIPNHPSGGYVGISKHADSVFTFSNHDSTFQFLDTPRGGFLDAWTVLDNLHKVSSHKKKHKDTIIISSVNTTNWTAYGGNSVNDTLFKTHFWQIDENKWHLKYSASNKYKWRWDHIVRQMDSLSSGLKDTYILVDDSEIWGIIDSTTFYKLGN